MCEFSEIFGPRITVSKKKIVDKISIYFVRVRIKIFTKMKIEE